MTQPRLKRINEAKSVLKSLGMPAAQQNDRSALCLLALLNLTPRKAWSKAGNPCMGITPIMQWVEQKYQKPYKPNTRETFRRQTMHQFVSAGIVRYNPDSPERPVNSPHAVYQIEAETLDLLRLFGTDSWSDSLTGYLANRDSLLARYAKEREQTLIPVKVTSGNNFSLSPGKHSKLIRAIIEEFAPRFAPGSKLIYAGDTGSKWSYFDESTLRTLHVEIDSHGKMPDVVVHDVERDWLLLVEAVTSHGPVDGKRHDELVQLFSGAKAGFVFVTAFLTRSALAKYLVEIAWETEVWIAENPSHLIRFNGERFLGPYNSDP